MPQFFYKLKRIFPTLRFTLTPTRFADSSRRVKSGLNAIEGFTLVEVMVTTAIILLLSGLSYSVITAAQRSNRDTLRKTDLNNIQSTLQQYYTDQSYYPSLGVSGLTAGSPLTNCTGAPTPCTVSKTYLNKLPGDPTGSNYYFVKLPSSPVACDNQSVGTRCYNYCIYATLENPPVTSTTPSSTSCPLPVSGQSFNYVVTQP